METPEVYMPKKRDLKPWIYVGAATTPLAERAAQFVHAYYEAQYLAEKYQAKIEGEPPPEKVPLPKRELMVFGQEINNRSLVAVHGETWENIRGVMELWAISPHRLQLLLEGDINEPDLNSDDFLSHGAKIDGL